jgi:hypothetical protein
VGGGEDLGEDLNGAGWVGDAVVEDDDGSGGQIFCYEPADVPDGRMHGVVRVGGAEHAVVAVGAGEAELAGAGYAAGWAKELWGCGGAHGRIVGCRLGRSTLRPYYAYRLLGLLEVADELVFRIKSFLQGLKPNSVDG